ncbi:hypothetical protein F4805DRAFT_134827 [Annulohypoxylon moriforme]|nr:hypothetical protein F4805DRAFT_134827 [Annulohypoxylon moriforme]
MDLYGPSSSSRSRRSRPSLSPSLSPNLVKWGSARTDVLWARLVALESRDDGFDQVIIDFERSLVAFVGKSIESYENFGLQLRDAVLEELQKMFRSRRKKKDRRSRPRIEKRYEDGMSCRFQGCLSCLASFFSCFCIFVFILSLFFSLPLFLNVIH